MQPVSTPIFPITSFSEVLKDILALSHDEFDYFADEIRSSDAFEYGLVRCKKIAERIGRSPESIAFTMRALEYLYTRAQIPEIATQNIRTVMVSFVDGFDKLSLNESQKSILADRLKSLIEPRPSIDESIKIQRLRDGVLNNLVSIDNFIDLRPLYNADKTEVLKFVTTIQLRISTNSPNPNQRELLLQLDNKSIEILKEAIKEVEKKQASLSKAKIDFPLV